MNYKSLTFVLGLGLLTFSCQDQELTTINDTRPESTGVNSTGTSFNPPKEGGVGTGGVIEVCQLPDVAITDIKIDYTDLPLFPSPTFRFPFIIITTNLGSAPLDLGKWEFAAWGSKDGVSRDINFGGSNYHNVILTTNKIDSFKWFTNPMDYSVYKYIIVEAKPICIQTPGSERCQEYPAECTASNNTFVQYIDILREAGEN